MKGERKLKREFEAIIRAVWKIGNRLYSTHLRYPKVGWFHQKPNTKDKDKVAGYALDWQSVHLCYEYAHYYKEQMEAVCIHEVAHCFATFYNKKIDRTESTHGYLWRQTAKNMAKAYGCKLPVAYHAFHEMDLTNKQIRVCMKKRRSKK